MVGIPNSAERETVVDPESIKVLVFAFDDAWSRIRNSRSWFARPAYARATREVLAKRIFEMAQKGVKDPQTLADELSSFFVPITVTIATAKPNSLEDGIGSRTVDASGSCEGICCLELSVEKDAGKYHAGRSGPCARYRRYFSRMF
jgi:hypothetical protein